MGDDIPSSTLRDPLPALGYDIFVDVLSWVGTVQDLSNVEKVCKGWREVAKAHSSWLWRFAAIDLGIDDFELQAYDKLAATGQFDVHPSDHRLMARDVTRLLDVPKPPQDWLAPRSSRRPTPLATPGIDPCRVNWRYVCEVRRRLAYSWRNAYCQLRWITPPTPKSQWTEDCPPPNTVWRIKSVPEDNVILSTSRMNGLVAVDRYTSEPLFSINGLEGYAHLEAGRGFLVFDRPGSVQPMAGWNFDDSSNSALEVWRNHEAQQRSTLQRKGESVVSATAQSHTHPNIFVPEDPDSPLPRGHYAHFRTLSPPTRCMAYRLHVDGADGGSPRAVLASAGTEAIYIWHLEEDQPMETIARGWPDVGRPNYIELDDEHVFICLDRQMHVYSRQNRSLLVSFPPVHDRENDDHRDECCARAIPLSLTHDFIERLEPDPQSLSQLPDGGKYAPIATAHQREWEAGEGPFYTTLERATAMHAVGDPDDSEEYDTQWEFSACHYTPDYLVCTAKSGGVFLVQDYRKVLREVASVPAKRRSKYITDNTVVLGLGTTVRQLTTFGHRLALCTSFNVILIDTRDMMKIVEDRDDSKPRPLLTAHVLHGNHPQAMKMSSCIQADARTIYLTYWAAGEADVAQSRSSPTYPPDSAVEGFGMCIKAWDFSADWGQMPSS